MEQTRRHRFDYLARSKPVAARWTQIYDRAGELAGWLKAQVFGAMSLAEIRRGIVALEDELRSALAIMARQLHVTACPPSRPSGKGLDPRSLRARDDGAEGFLRAPGFRLFTDCPSAEEGVSTAAAASFDFAQDERRDEGSTSLTTTAHAERSRSIERRRIEDTSDDGAAPDMSSRPSSEAAPSRQLCLSEVFLVSDHGV